MNTGSRYLEENAVHPQVEPLRKGERIAGYAYLTSEKAPTGESPGEKRQSIYAGRDDRKRSSRFTGSSPYSTRSGDRGD
jgi:hypothetical protein